MKFYPHTILIVSHMRSGSSLLEHILSTNDEIIGFGEQNRIYKNFIDTIIKMNAIKAIRIQTDPL